MIGHGNNKTKRKYVPNVPNLHKVCDSNYGFLMRLLPDCDTQDLSYEFEASAQLKYKITILECSRYSSLVSISQQAGHLPRYLRPVMEVRLYHDAQMAEVIRSQHMGALRPCYPYPNMNMHQRNEKEMVNHFLAEWLQFCLAHNVHTSSTGA